MANDRRLTEEEKQLAEKNVAFVRWWVKRNPPPNGLDIAEWESELMFALLRAVKNYREGGIKFTAYAKYYFQRQYSLSNEHRYRVKRDPRRVEPISADFDYMDSRSFDPSERLEKEEASSQVAELSKVLTKKQLAVIKGMLAGDSIEEISVRDKVSKYSISRHRLDAIDRMSNYAMRKRLAPAI